jgi:hypothetical protein
MEKYILQILQIIAVLAIFACSTPQKGDMALVVLSYKQGIGSEQDAAYRDEPVKMQVNLEKTATLIADCLLTLDYMAEGRSIQVNRKSFDAFFKNLSSILISYNDQGLNESIKSIYELGKDEVFDTVKIRGIIENGIIGIFFKSYVGKIKCASCYDYQEFLGHISFWYYLLSHDLFKDNLYVKNKICGQSIVDSRRKFARKLYREFKSKFEYIRDAGTLADYQNKNNLYRILDRGKKSIGQVTDSKEKKVITQPFVINNVDMMYEIDRFERNDYDISTEGLEFHFNWK